MTKPSVFIVAPEYFGISDFILKAFERSGFSASIMKYDTKLSFFERALNKARRLAPVLEGLSDPLFKIFLRKNNLRLLSAVRQRMPDLIFIIKGEFVFPETVRTLSAKMGILTVSYQWDDPFFSLKEFNYYDRFRRESFIRSAGIYDHIFVFDSQYVSELKDKGVVCVDYLPLATDPEFYTKQDLSKEEKAEYGFDVCFVGAPFKNRMELINRLNGINMGVFGADWDKHRHGMQGNYYKGEAKGDKVLKLYSASKIAINIHHPQSLAGVNTRTFDILACGAFEISDYKKDIESLFKIDEEMVCYKNNDELIEKINYYLKHPVEMEAIAQRGREKVLNCHTWAHRVSAIVDVLLNNETIAPNKKKNLKKIKEQQK